MKINKFIKNIKRKKVKNLSDITISIKINNENVQEIPLKILFNNQNEEFAPPAPPIFNNFTSLKYACITKDNENYFSINEQNFNEVIDFNIYVQGEIGGIITYDVDTNFGFFVKGNKVIDDSGYSNLTFYFTKEVIKGCSKFKNSQGVFNYNYNSLVSENYDIDAEPNDSICFPKGGVTKNNFLTMGDAIKIARYSVGLENLTKEELLIANTNNNKTIDIGDALNISRAVAGLSSPLTQ